MSSPRHGCLDPCSRRFHAVATAFFLLASALSLVSAARAIAEDHWYKGHTHCHSFWSDGDDFPEMVLDGYKRHGYDFACLSDHNVLMQGDRWRPLKTKERPITPELLDRCRERFGKDWLTFRGKGDRREVLLKTFDQIRGALEEPGRFLMIQAEEISGEAGDKNVHVNAVNLVDLIMPQGGHTVRDAIQADLAAARRQAQAAGRPILAHVNHPNWKNYDVSASDLAQAVDARFFEVCNNSYDVLHFGDATHPSVERIWDIANTIRLAGLKQPPLYGVGSDDAHNYRERGPRLANPFRAWIVVRAEKLEVEPLLAAMVRGDFYASTGVALKQLRYDPAVRTLSVEVDPKPGTNYVIEFIGSTTDADPTGRDTSKIGQVLARHEGVKAVYRLQGNELYVRAAIRSDRKLDNPPADAVDTETAWTQPVGWEQRVAPPK
jgi:hypothetical protein